MFRLEKRVEVDAVTAPHGFQPYPTGTISSSTRGYTGAAARSGYASQFGDRERRWEEYEFNRKHMAGPNHQPGAAWVVLANEQGQGQAGLTAEIGGRMCTSGPGGMIRLLDASFFNKVSESLAEERSWCQKLTSQAMEGKELCGAMFGPQVTSLLGPAATNRPQTAFGQQRGGGDHTECEKIYAEMGMPAVLYEVSADPDHLNSLSPYSAIYADGTAKLLCIIRAQNVAFVGGDPSPGNLANVTREDKNKLATQQKTSSVDV